MWVWGVWIAAALLLFWGIGAYNRLVRLRAAVARAFAALDEQLVRQLVWIQGGLPEALRDGPHTTPGELNDEVTAAWGRLHAASEQFAVALAQARAQPLDVAAMAALVMSHEALRTAWAHALADAVPPDAVPSADRLQARWMRLLHQSLPLRAAFNDAAQSYNQAIRQFPASLLAHLFGFQPAGTVTRLAEGR
ncbi:MAG TPA: LemA family protein [Ottowia sp.]|nr:LemA family protein [Ottowia sp.]HNI85483.1 LemA family protein [Ottowia sp.]HNJ46427.1 LemA family protein [Ottowia sp.]HNN34593.1 LemA family protein [Ottowia sp.]HNO41969.1 LemA family protein [Ottowia sp.]